MHRDLKPSNLLVAPAADGRLVLKVVDFGLSSGPGELSLAAIGGTLAYMAPELFRGAPPSESADLYAAGMVACELLGGGPPFSTAERTSRLLFEVLRETPDLSRLPPALQGVLGRTLSKVAAERPSDVGSLLRELCAALGIERPAEPLATRDSSVIAARFTGREPELATLAAALASAQDGAGAVWLLAGESGVGKSRLLDELRSLALPDGVLVLRGQAVESGGTAYHLWREPLRLLALHLELDGHELALLAAVVPDLPALLERTVERTAAAELQGQGFRLLHALLEVLGRVSLPTLVLLEDLQWADAESLQLLAQLAERVRGNKLLVVASYREEEAASLPSQVPGAQVLRLSRLGRTAMLRLCESILGGAAHDPRLIDLVSTETEGNTYFLIEWVRALATAAGATDRVGELLARGRPEGLLPGGVAEALARRLLRVPEEARPGLRLAAVAGRQLDPNLLRQQLPQLEAMIHAAAAVGVLEATGTEWRFSHDKLRERILAELKPAERRALHLQVAEGLESVYHDEDDHAAAIAHHFHEGGRPALAARHYARAGKAALSRGAPFEAEGHFERATRLHDQTQAAQVARVQAYSGLAQARYASGKLQDSLSALEPMFAAAGWPLPRGPLQMARDIAEQLYELALRRARAKLQLPDAALTETQRQICDAELQALAIGEVFVWMARPELYLVCTLRGLNTEEAFAVPQTERHMLIGLLFLLSFTPLRPWLLDWVRRNEAERETLSGFIKVSHLRVVALMWLNDGKAELATHVAQKGVAAARALRDEHAALLVMLQLQLALGSIEDYAQLLQVSEEMEAIALRMQNRRYVATGLLGQGMAWMRYGEFERAAHVLERAREYIPPEFGLMPLAMLLGQTALCSLRLGRTAQALELAERAMQTSEQIAWAMLPVMHVFTTVLEVYLSAPDSQRYRARIERALSRLEAIARSFPLARPRTYYYRARVEWWRGHVLRTHFFLRLILRTTANLQLVYEAGLAHEWLARLARTPTGRLLVPEGAEHHLRAALSCFERSQARPEAARLSAELGV